MLGYTYYIVTKKLTHIYAQNILSNIFQAEEEGAMEEDEVEEMDVVEEEMAGGEDEEVQLVDEVAVDEEAVVQMRQTFHQVSGFSFCILCIERGKRRQHCFIPAIEVSVKNIIQICG